MQREWCEDDVWPACEECGSKNSSVRYNLGADFDRVTAERDAALGREKECQRQLGERWKDIEALRNTVESADADKEAYAQNAIDLRKRVDALQLRLTAADERADVLEGLLANAHETAAKWVEKRCDDYVNEHGSIDPETGTVEFPGDGEEYVGELMEIVEGLRALKPAEGGGDDTAQDRAYRNGLMQGYNLALNGSEKEYQDAVARYSGGKNAE